VGIVLVVVLIWATHSGGAGDDAKTRSAPGSSSSSTGSNPNGTSVSLGDLPAQAQHTVQLIKAGGPYPYDRDGITFGNREGLLPPEPGGYYREFTVPTPGSADRGARRIVLGEGGELYYSADHYASFRTIEQ
jgi:ribonuclease T1